MNHSTVIISKIDIFSKNQNSQNRQDRQLFRKYFTDGEQFIQGVSLLGIKGFRNSRLFTFSKTLSEAKLATSKPLSIMEGDSLRMYSFVKAPMSKGDRLDDVSVTIEPGDVFAIFMDTAKALS